MAQMKERIKTSEKELTKMEMSNLSEAEFKTLITRMLKELSEFFEHLITSVLNSASDRLVISISFSSFSGVLFCFFIWAIFLCLLYLAASLCLFLCIR